MTIITPIEISQARSALISDPNATAALKVLEECEGDLEAAFEVLMIESGALNEADRSGFGTSLEQFAQRFRSVVCQEEFQEEIVDGFSRDLLTALVPMIAGQLLSGNLPAVLAIPIAMYILKLGIKRYCKPTAPKS